MRISDCSSDVCSSDRPAVAAHRFHFIGKPAQRLVIGVDVERDAAIKARNRIVPCGCTCPVSDMLGRDISLRSGAEYLRTRNCAHSCDLDRKGDGEGQRVEDRENLGGRRISKNKKKKRKK